MPRSAQGLLAYFTSAIAVAAAATLWSTPPAPQPAEVILKVVGDERCLVDEPGDLLVAGVDGEPVCFVRPAAGSLVP